MKSMRLWLILGIFNLILVASLGTLMRYKIGFDFPFFNQKNLQHAHSHFAFAGWISHILMVFMMDFIQTYTKKVKIYQQSLILNMIASYGMLVSFAIQGYALFSIIFSSLSLLISFIFCVFFLNDLRKVETLHPSKNYFIASLVFNIISMLGTAMLIYMMASKFVPQNLYLSSIYFYLHFQYNGWFLFAIIGLLFLLLKKYNPELQYSPTIFWLFAGSCIPAYMLSILWIKLPTILYIIVVIASVIQLFAWSFLWKEIKHYWKNLSTHVHIVFKFVFLLVAFAFTIKVLLQAFSVIPQISNLAFGFRSIVVAYLHLVLLAITSIFLLNYILIYISNNQPKKIVHIFYMIFVSGVFATEATLGIQGIASFSYIPIPYVHFILFGLALLMLLGLIGIFLSLLQKKHSNHHLYFIKTLPL